VDEICDHLHDIACKLESSGTEIVYYIDSPERSFFEVAVFFVCAYLVACRGLDVEEIFTKTIVGDMKISGFAHKASLGETTVDVNVSLKSMLHALSLASSKGWYDHYNFPAADYLPENKWGFTQTVGKRINLVLPCKQIFDQVEYVETLRKRGVSSLLMIHSWENKGETRQIGSALEKLGLNVDYMDFEIFQAPKPFMVKSFFEIIDKRRGRLAISHMTVADDVIGASLELELGWVGTLIALYIMRYDGFTVDQTIAWIRLARPGIYVTTNPLVLMKYEGASYTKKHVAEFRQNPSNLMDDMLSDSFTMSSTPTALSPPLTISSPRGSSPPRMTQSAGRLIQRTLMTRSWSPLTLRTSIEEMGKKMRAWQGFGFSKSLGNLSRKMTL